MNHRRLTAALVLVAVTSLTAACGSGSGSTSSSAKGPITFVSTGSAFQDDQNTAWLKPYTASTGTTFVNTGPPDTSKLIPMVKSGNVSWDVLDQDPSVAIQYCGQYLQKLDFTVIDKSLFPPGSVSDCAVPDYLAATLFMYDKSKFAANPPTTIADFFDTKKYPGKRIIPPGVTQGVFEDALMADGVAPDKLYPLDIDRALRKMQSIKKDLIWPDTFGQLQQAMETGQVVMALSSTARALHTLQDGKPWAPVWDKTIATWNALMVPKGAPHAAEAMKFIAFVAKDAQQKRFAELETLGPINSRVVPTLNAIQQQVTAFSAEHRAGLVYTNVQYWAQHSNEVTSKFTAWLAG